MNSLERTHNWSIFYVPNQPTGTQQVSKSLHFEDSPSHAGAITSSIWGRKYIYPSTSLPTPADAAACSSVVTSRCRCSRRQCHQMSLVARRTHTLCPTCICKYAQACKFLCGVGRKWDQEANQKKAPVPFAIGLAKAISLFTSPYIVSEKHLTTNAS